MAVSGDGVPIHLATPITNPALLRVCTKRIGMTGTMSLAVTPVTVGTVLAATSPLVRRFPRHFRLATADDVGGT